MTIRRTMRHAACALGLALAYLGLVPATPAAADREHQQIMADLRMLQEQTQQLQALMNNLGEALRAVSTRIDDQTALERKAFADGKVQMDAIAGDIRVVREKVDETNVRLGTISQELESLRQAIPEPGAFTAMPTGSDAAAPGVPGTSGPPAAAAAPVPANPGIQPQRLFQSSFGDYTSGNYSLAVEGFQSYLKYFPRSPQAPEAQLYIGEALFQDKKFPEAVAAYERVIADYPTSNSVPHAYYKRGVTLDQLGDKDRARESYETAIKQFPDSQSAILARQGLERMNRPTR